MKRVFLCAVGLILTLSSGLRAQTITGTWQGTLPIEKDSHVALKIVKANDGSLRGYFYSLDRGATGNPLSSVNYVAPQLSVTSVYDDISFQGKLSADGKSVRGIWTQDKQSYPLDLAPATPATLWKPDGPVPLAPMSATADPAFEVATIKPSPPGARGGGVGGDFRHSRYVSAKNATVKDLIRFAYNVRSRQISGGPSWIDESKFDIDGEPDTEGLPSYDQRRLMFRKLLANRFHLAVHSVYPISPVYALTLKKSHAKLSPSDVSPSDPCTDFNGRAYTKTEVVNGSIQGKAAADGEMQIEYAHFTMPQFAEVLMNYIQDRQVVDETGLKGCFDFTIAIPTSDLKDTPTSGPEDDRSNAFRLALQPLGFSLVPKKAPLQVIVVDTLDKPSAN